MCPKNECCGKRKIIFAASALSRRVGCIVLDIEVGFASRDVGGGLRAAGVLSFLRLSGGLAATLLALETFCDLKDTLWFERLRSQAARIATKLLCGVHALVRLRLPSVWVREAARSLACSTRRAEAVCCQSRCGWIVSYTNAVNDSKAALYTGNSGRREGRRRGAGGYECVARGR